MKKYGLLMIGGALLVSGVAQADTVVVQTPDAKTMIVAPQQQEVQKPVVVQPSTPQVVPGNAVVIPSDRVRLSVQRDAVTGEIIPNEEKKEETKRESLRDRVRDKME